MDELFEYYANDALSEKLLKTIPVKVIEWLRTMEKRFNITLLHQGNTVDYDGQRIRLSVIGHSSGSPGSLSFGEQSEPDFVKFWWDEGFENFRTSDLTLISAATDLESFVEAEKKFYDELALLERELDYKHGDSKFTNGDAHADAVISKLRAERGLELYDTAGGRLQHTIQQLKQDEASRAQ